MLCDLTSVYFEVLEVPAGEVRLLPRRKARQPPDRLRPPLRPRGLSGGRRGVRGRHCRSRRRGLPGQEARRALLAVARRAGGRPGTYRRRARAGRRLRHPHQTWTPGRSGPGTRSYAVAWRAFTSPWYSVISSSRDQQHSGSRIPGVHPVSHQIRCGHDSVHNDSAVGKNVGTIGTHQPRPRVRRDMRAKRVDNHQFTPCVKDPQVTIGTDIDVVDVRELSGAVSFPAQRSYESACKIKSQNLARGRRRC